ncbi:MAG: hypothetical protein ACPL06_03395 [Candidatus Anstonellales archaeon]
MKVISFLLKDKQFFAWSDGLKLVGNPVSKAKELRERGIKLLHIKDADIKTMNNFDIYDKLTYIINVQVEAPCDGKIIKRLLEVKARVVVELPCALLEKFKESKKLLVGKVRDWGNTDGIEFVNDVIVFSESEIEKVERLGKRVLFWGKSKKKVFAEVEGYV